jgi:hypothetical protein
MVVRVSVTRAHQINLINGEATTVFNENFLKAHLEFV